MSAEQRDCPACGQAFTWTTASPRQRYCSRRCKDTTWKAAHRQARTPAPSGARPGASNDAGATGATRRPDRHATTGRATGASNDAGATLTAVQDCPHCHQQIAVVTWLITPAAAHVRTPPRHAATVRDLHQINQ